MGGVPVEGELAALVGGGARAAGGTAALLDTPVQRGA